MNVPKAVEKDVKYGKAKLTKASQACWQSVAAYPKSITYPQDLALAGPLSGSFPPWELTPRQQTYLESRVSVSQWRPIISSLDVKGIH